MIVRDEKLLDEFRNAGCCEYCHEPPDRGTLLDPCHIFARGLGGGSRLDIRINLLAMHRRCHAMAHDGNIKRWHLLEIVAEREGKTPDAIEEEIWRLLRAPKCPTKR